jgi:hypothetical protein
LHEHRRDLVPIGSENDELEASGILDVLRRFGACRDHRWDSFLLVLWLQRSIPETRPENTEEAGVLMPGPEGVLVRPLDEFNCNVAIRDGPWFLIGRPVLTAAVNSPDVD